MERFEGYEGKRNNINILWSKKELVKNYTVINGKNNILSVLEDRSSIFYSRTKLYLVTRRHTLFFLSLNPWLYKFFIVYRVHLYLTRLILTSA